MDSAPPTSPEAPGAASAGGGDPVAASSARFAARLGRRAAPVVRTPFGTAARRGPGRLATSLDSFSGRVGLSQTARWALESTAANAVGEDVRPPISYWPWDEEVEPTPASPAARTAAPASPVEPDGFVPSGDARLDQLRRILLKPSRPSAVPVTRATPAPAAPRRAPRPVHRGLPQVLHRKGTAARRPRPGDMARRLAPASVDPRSVTPRPAAAGVPANLPAAAAQVQAAAAPLNDTDRLRRAATRPAPQAAPAPAPQAAPAPAGPAAPTATPGRTSATPGRTSATSGPTALTRSAIAPTAAVLGEARPPATTGPSTVARRAVDLTAAARSLPNHQVRPSTPGVDPAPTRATPQHRAAPDPVRRASLDPAAPAGAVSGATPSPPTSPAGAAATTTPGGATSGPTAPTREVTGNGHSPVSGAPLGAEPAVAPPAARSATDGADAVRRSPTDPASTVRGDTAARPTSDLAASTTPTTAQRRPERGTPATARRADAAPSDSSSGPATATRPVVGEQASRRDTADGDRVRSAPGGSTPQDIVQAGGSSVPTAPGAATAGLSVAPGDLRRSSAATPAAEGFGSTTADAPTAPRPTSAGPTPSTEVRRSVDPSAPRAAASAPTASPAPERTRTTDQTTGGPQQPRGGTPAPAGPSVVPTVGGGGESGPGLDTPRPPVAVTPSTAGTEQVRRRESAAPDAGGLPARLGTERPASSPDRTDSPTAGIPWPAQRAAATPQVELGARSRPPSATARIADTEAATATRPSTAPPLTPRLRPVESPDRDRTAGPDDSSLVARYRPTWQGDDAAAPAAPATAPAPTVRRSLDRDHNVTPITRDETSRPRPPAAPAADLTGATPDRPPVADPRAEATAPAPAATGPAPAPTVTGRATTPAAAPDRPMPALARQEAPAARPETRRPPSASTPADLPAASAAGVQSHDVLRPAPPSVRRTALGGDPAGVVAPLPLATATEAPAARFESVLRRTAAAPAPLPVQWRPLASAIAGERRVRVSTNAASRAALRAAGKRAATTGDVIHLARPLTGPADAPLLAHELTHVAAPSPAPRFFDDERDSPEERRAEMIADVIRRSPVLPRPHAGASMRALGPRTPSVARTASTDAGPSTTADEMVRRLTSSAARPTGSPGAAPVIRRSSEATVHRSSSDARPAETIVRRAQLDLEEAPAPATTAQSSDAPPATAAEIGNRTWPVMTGGTSAHTLHDLTDWIIEQVEERVMRQLERRGGRYRGGF